ncbi:MAG: hypothetical protein ABFC88_12400 [Thermoguttaceae bacterium]
MTETYRDLWQITVEERANGWFYAVQYSGFKAEYGPFIGPASAMDSAKMLVDVLEEEIEW